MNFEYEVNLYKYFTVKVVFLFSRYGDVRDNALLVT